MSHFLNFVLKICLEIAKVRSALFHLESSNKEALILPDASGNVITVQEKVYVPVKEFPDVRTKKSFFSSKINVNSIKLIQRRISREEVIFVKFLRHFSFEVFGAIRKKISLFFRPELKEFYVFFYCSTILSGEYWALGE